MESEKFDQLEAKVKGVVDRYLQLKGQVAEQDELLRTRSRELQEANEAIRALNEEKAAVRDKVEALLGKLDSLDVP